MFSKTYELSLSPNYVEHWGVVEAVRELFQNALDSDSPFEYTLGTDSLSITSRFSRLEPKTLLLGTTSKSDNKDAIGSFGEGYKIAMLVLTRLKRRMTIFNNDRKWTPEFRHSKQYEQEVLCIRDDNYPEGRGKGLTFQIEGLTQSDIEAIIESNLHMWSKIGQVHETSKGRILLEVPGKLFVGGLYVCETELEYGYDIKPEFLKLERDRQTVSSFDLKFVTKDMWFELDNYPKIIEMMERKSPDIEYAEWSAPEVVKEEVFKHFVARNPGKVPVKSQEELDKYVREGITETVYINSSSYYGALTSSSSYHRTDLKSKLKVKTPTEYLQEFLSDNRGQMRTSAIVAFKKLMGESENWKAK